MTAQAAQMHTLCMGGKTTNGPHDAVAALSAERIKKFRERARLTQAELARRTGWDESKADTEQQQALSPSRIANYEQATRRVGFEEGEVFAKIFGMPAAYFMGAISEIEAQLLIAFRATQGPQDPTAPPSGTERAVTEVPKSKRKQASRP
ncbi:MAG TPA: helix-turn-helix transcriptional regulator [Burkholderiales bacterium]|nr:helix-turn-helix transcriptional regulator [Burkholderiales bacterium]